MKQKCKLIDLGSTRILYCFCIFPDIFSSYSGWRSTKAFLTLVIVLCSYVFFFSKCDLVQIRIWPTSTQWTRTEQICYFHTFSSFNLPSILFLWLCIFLDSPFLHLQSLFYIFVTAHSVIPFRIINCFLLSDNELAHSTGITEKKLAKR